VALQLAVLQLALLQARGAAACDIITCGTVTGSWRYNLWRCNLRCCSLRYYKLAALQLATLQLAMTLLGSDGRFNCFAAMPTARAKFFVFVFFVFRRQLQKSLTPCLYTRERKREKEGGRGFKPTMLVGRNVIT